MSPRRQERSRGSQNVLRFTDGAFGEAREAEARDVERGLAVDDQLGDEASGDRPHREPVAAEPGGQHETAEPRYLAEDRHEIRRGVDVPGPASRDLEPWQ